MLCFHKNLIFHKKVRRRTVTWLGKIYFLLWTPPLDVFATAFDNGEDIIKLYDAKQCKKTQNKISILFLFCFCFAKPNRKQNSFFYTAAKYNFEEAKKICKNNFGQLYTMNTVDDFFKLQNKLIEASNAGLGQWVWLSS